MDIRFGTSNETSSNIRFPIEVIQFPNQNQNIYYQTPMALHLTPNQVTNGSHINNNVLYPHCIPYQLGHQQLMLNTNPHLVISVPCAPGNMPDNNNMINQSSFDSCQNSSVTSPISMVSSKNQLQINYSLSKWNELYPFYDGNDYNRPSAGQLRNGKYFTQRSAGKDIYMVFDSKSDYINNFVNYYFSNKNFSSDEKLFNLMDDSGSVALSDLIKFPRLAQIGTTIDDIIEALKFSHFVVVVNLKNETKGIRRSDGWFPSKLIDDSKVSVVNSQWTANSADSSASFHKLSSDIYRNTKQDHSVPANILKPSNSISTNQTILDSSNAATIQLRQNNDVIKSHQIDIAPQNNNNNSYLYFNASNGAINQPMFASAAYVHGISPSNFQSLQSPPGTTQIIAPGHGPHLILNAAHQHYSNPAFFQQNQTIQLRSMWPGHNVTDLSRNPLLYNSSTITNNNSNNNRHVIGAGGNNQTNNYKQCQ